MLRRMPIFFPPVAAALVSLIAVLTLIGWQFRIHSLREPFGGFMTPNTALCFLLLSAALALHRWKDRPWAYTLGVTLAISVAVFSAIILFEHLTQINTGLSQVFFHHRLNDWNLPTVPGRFAPNTAICLILLTTALALSYEDGRKTRIEFLTALSLLISGLAAIGHVYGVRALYSLEVHTYMALSTAVSLMLVGAGMLVAVAPGGWMGVVLRDDAAGLLSRRIFLFSFTVVPFMGWLALYLQRRGGLSSEFADSLMVVAVLVIITSTVFRSAREIRRLERERRLAEDQLREAEKLAVTGRLAATLAHEVNNPLAAVTNILYLLRNDTGLLPQSKQFLEMAEEELSRVSHITRQTLAFYREPVAPAHVHPSELVRQTVAIFGPKLEAKQLHTVVEDRLNSAVVFFPGELKQIITNLLANAIDATDVSGKITIRVARGRTSADGNEPGFRITVSDNGTGIDPKDRKQLFQPFFTTKGQKGTGLGLWVTQGLVTKHGGQLRMRTSTQGAHRGTSFMIFLPAELEKQVTEPQALTNAAP